METFLALESNAVVWLNQWIGRSSLLDGVGYLLVSDYFVPLAMCFWMLGLWFFGNSPAARQRNQTAVLAAAISLGFANLAVLVLNQYVFRERPFTHYELTSLFYQPTDSSFPANPAAIAFAVASAIFLANRRASWLLFGLAVLWSLVRVSSGLFFPSDIVAGGLIGATVAGVVTIGMRLIEPAPSWVLRGARLLHLA